MSVTILGSETTGAQPGRGARSPFRTDGFTRASRTTTRASREAGALQEIDRGSRLTSEGERREPQKEMSVDDD